MKCLHCGKEIPEDALFCPYCGRRLVRYVLVEDVEELGKIASSLSKYLPNGWKCGVDKKKRRLSFSPSFKISFYISATRDTSPAYPCLLILHLEYSLRRIEEEFNIKLELNESSITTNVPTLYYKVLRKEEKKH